jgi:hypothetical protein
LVEGHSAIDDLRIQGFNALSARSKKKCGWPIDLRMGGVIFKVTPHIVVALPEKQLPTAPTKWRFA